MPDHAPHGNSNEPLTPILLITTGRTGATGLMQALGRHPRIIRCNRWPHEQRPAFYMMKMRNQVMIRKDAEDEFGGPVAFYKNKNSPFHDDEEVETRIYSQVFLDGLDRVVREGTLSFYRELSLAYQMPQITHFLEKMKPVGSRWFRRVFPHSKTVFLIRDPRDAMVSAMSFFGGVSPEALRSDAGEELGANPAQQGASRAPWLNQYIEGWRQLQESMPEELNRPKSFLVRYEDVVANPADTMAKLLTDLGVEAGEHLDACVDALEKPVLATHTTSGSREQSVGRWRQVNWHKMPFHDTISELADRLGYAA